MKDRDPDTPIMVLGTKTTRRELAELEAFKGSSTLAGDMLRFNDAMDDLARALTEPFVELVRKFRR